MPQDLADYLEPRVRRLGYLGEMFQVGANAPQVLQHFLHLTDALKEGLAFDIGETVVLTVAGWMDNAYERNQHERLCVRTGLGSDWLREVERLLPDDALGLTPGQRAAQRFALAALESRGKNVEAAFSALQEHFTAAEAVTLVFLVGRYVTHALVVNTFQLAPPVPSVFEDGFQA